MLHAYALSDRARRRREKSWRGEDAANYLFLTQHGQPYYESKADRNAVRDSSQPLRRSALAGRPLRKFIEDYVLPEAQKTLPKFKYRFHDLRATFGMNWVAFQMRDSGAESAGANYMWARDQLRKLMWHKSPVTTDKYLEYRQQMHHLQRAQEGWSHHLVDLIKAG
jgi:hypothetical protein